MATKKSAAKKTAVSEPAVKTAAKRTATKKVAAKKVGDVAALGAEAQPKSAAKTAGKHKPSHHDISVQAYLLWERDGKKHGQHEHYWKQAEHDLHEQ